MRKPDVGVGLLIAIAMFVFGALSWRAVDGGCWVPESSQAHRRR